MSGTAITMLIRDLRDDLLSCLQRSHLAALCAC